jgi:hypothetical protein
MFCLRSAEAFLRSKSVLLAAVFFSVSSIAFPQDSFMGHFTPSGGGASIIHSGDFNGKLDLAFISNTTNKVYFYKGSGTGTFASAGSLTVGSASSTPEEVKVGDFNNDGKPDLVVSNFTGLYVLWNNGGNFSFTVDQVGSSKFGILANPVDINQDGFSDLLVVYYTCEVGKDIPPGPCTHWKTLLGSANKTLRQTWNVNLPISFQGLWGTTATDINGDGINDIVGISGIYQLFIWLGNPDGTYQSTPLSFFIGSDSSASDVIASDFNRDGKIDFAMPTPGISSSTGVAVFLNATPRATCTPNQVSPSVTVCQPQNLTYSNSPVHWIADSRDTSHPVNAVQIYVDNKLVVNSPSSSLNEFLTLSKGPHFVVTKAWDSSGANFRSDHNITIYSGTPGETCPAATNSINACLPKQNEVSSTSLHVFANADSAANQITAVQVYIDGKLIYNDTSGATYVDTAFTVATGSHSVVVKAWDANGTAFTVTQRHVKIGETAGNIFRCRLLACLRRSLNVSRPCWAARVSSSRACRLQARSASMREAWRRGHWLRSVPVAALQTNQQRARPEFCQPTPQSGETDESSAWAARVR